MSFVLLITNFTSTDVNASNKIFSKYHSELIKSMDENGVVDKDKLPKNVRTELENRYKEISQFLDEIGHKKTKANNLSKKIKSTKDAKLKEQMETELANLKNEIFYLEYNAEELIGLKKLTNSKEENKVKTSSTYGDAIAYVDLYWDMDMNTYVITGNFDWQNGNWINDGGVGDIGGLDGIALQLSRKMVKIDYGMSLYDSTGNYHQMTKDVNWFPDYSDYGLGFRYQDYIFETYVPPMTTKGYVATEGYAHIYFDYYDGISSGDYVVFRSRYGHSYDQTNLSSFGISSTGISLGWTEYNTEFDAQAEGYHQY